MDDLFAGKRPFFDVDKVKLGIQNNQLSSLLCAVLDAQGGKVTLTPEQAAKEWEGASLNFEQGEDGSVTLVLVPSAPRY